LVESDWRRFALGTIRDSWAINAFIHKMDPPFRFYLEDNNEITEYTKAINGIRRAYGRSNTAEALRVTRESALSPFRGARPGVGKLVVLITDGKSANRARTEEEAAINLAEGIGKGASQKHLGAK
jgi:hypothetical protein